MTSALVAYEMDRRGVLQRQAGDGSGQSTKVSCQGPGALTRTVAWSLSTATGKVRIWLWMAINTNFVTGDRYANFSFSRSRFRCGVDGRGAALLIDAGLAYAKCPLDVTHVTGKVNAANVPIRVLYAEFRFAPAT